VEGPVGPAAGEVVGGGVGVRVQWVVHAAVGPHRGHRDDAVVGLAQPANFRIKLKRLTGRGILDETEQGLFIRTRPNGESADGGSSPSLSARLL
jgi:hypothetical protein